MHPKKLYLFICALPKKTKERTLYMLKTRLFFQIAETRRKIIGNRLKRHFVT